MEEHRSRDARLEQIERESERERAKLVETVLALKSRISPDAIKAEVAQSVRRTGKDLLSDVERRARENPLRAAAIAAGVAYPAWRMLQAIPVPILLFGAGAALAGSGSRKTRIVEVDETYAMYPSTSPATAPVGAAELSRSTSAQPIAAGGSAPGGGASSHPSVGARVGAMADTVVSAASRASDTATSAYEHGVEATARAGQRVASAGRAGVDEVVGAIERHPLLAGGLGALLGVALAMTLPRSRAEDRLVGGTSDALKRRAAARVRTAAQEGVAAGERVVGEVQREAERQGLTADAAKRAVREAGDRARDAVDETADAVKDQMTRSGASKRDEPPSPAKDRKKG